jgi:hypothetical protein
MIALLLALAALWIAAGVGRLLVGRAEALAGARLERLVFSAAFGLALAGDGVYVIGWLGGLSFRPVTAWWIALALIGLPGMAANGRDVWRWLRGLRDPARRPAWPYAAAGAALALCGVVCLIGCYVPPTGREWDAISYHLADPKLYLIGHTIRPLPTEHHSNFPFCVEMLFASGLLYGGYALANLFNLILSALAAGAVYAFGRRLANRAVGVAAALLFATTPIVVWEARTAYIDVALALYAALGAFAAVSACREASERRRTELLALAGAAFGFALGVKYLAVVPFALVCGLLLARRVPLRQAALFALVGVAVGCPWYLKNAILLKNPVYPYLYGVFPHSVNWSRDRAIPYQNEQASFGYPHAPNKDTPAGDVARNLMLTPWRLVANGEKFDNPGNYTFLSQTGALTIGLALALPLLRRKSAAVCDVAILALAQAVFWFFNAQVSRYVISILPLLAVSAAYAAWRFADDLRGFKAARWGIMALIGLQCAALFWGVLALPLRVRDVPVRASGLLLSPGPGTAVTALSIPDALSILTQPDGTARMLSQRLDLYDVCRWVNSYTPTDSKLVLYDETRGFYLDREYIWGNGEHSAYIPYDRMRSGRDLTAWMQAHDIRYALIDMNNWHGAAGGAGAQAIDPARDGLEALRIRYVETQLAPGAWRWVLGDAIRSDWRPLFAEHGVVVLAIDGDHEQSRTPQNP